MFLVLFVVGILPFFAHAQTPPKVQDGVIIENYRCAGPQISESVLTGYDGGEERNVKPSPYGMLVSLYEDYEGKYGIPSVVIANPANYCFDVESREWNSQNQSFASPDQWYGAWHEGSEIEFYKVNTNQSSYYERSASVTFGGICPNPQYEWTAQENTECVAGVEHLLKVENKTMAREKFTNAFVSNKDEFVNWCSTSHPLTACCTVELTKRSGRFYSQRPVDVSYKAYSIVTVQGKSPFGTEAGGTERKWITTTKSRICSPPVEEDLSDLTATIELFPFATGNGGFPGFVTEVQNIGAVASTGATIMRYQIDEHTQGTPEYDFNIDRPGTVPVVAAGEERQISGLNWTPGGGTHAIRVCVDVPDSNIAEEDEGNNCSQPLVFTVQGAQQPDIIPTGMSPDSARVGEETTLRVTIANTGRSAANNFPNFIWVDSNGNGQYDAPGEAIWSGTRTLPAAGSGVSAANQDLVGTYTFTEQRNYVVGACVDNTPSWGAPSVRESNEQNNCYAKIVSVTSADMDLTVGNLSTEVDNQNSRVTITGPIRNLGSAGITGGIDLRVQLAVNSDQNAEYDQNVDVLDAVVDLAGGESKNASYAWQSVPAGIHQVRFCADPLNDYQETNENNNCSDPVTVAVGNISFTCSPNPAEAQVGQNVSWSAANVSGVAGTPTYSWRFNDGQTGTGSPYTRTYATSGTKTAELTVTGQNGSRTETCSAGVNGGGVVVTSPPSATLTITPNRIVIGEEALFTWGSENASRCDDAGGIITQGRTAGQERITPSQKGVNPYQVNCDGAIARDEVLVLDPNINVKVNNTEGTVRVAKNSEVTVSWSAEDVDSCTLRSSDGLINLSSTDDPWTGSQTVTTDQRTVYTITCSVDGVDETYTDSVVVNIPPEFEEF